MKYKDFYTNIEEDYPEHWDIETFISLTSFSKRVAYCNEHLQRLASGSSRIAYKIDDEKVLKLAKNKKGIAQNEVEADGFVQKAYDSIVAKVFNVDQNRLWLEMELAKKITPARFEHLLGFSIDYLSYYLRIFEMENNPSKFNAKYYINSLKSRIPADVKDLLDNSEFVNSITSLMVDMDMPAGDLGRISSYGEVVRNGNPTVVIIDLGLTNRVYSDFYSGS